MLSYHGPIGQDIDHSSTIIDTEHMSGSELTKDNP